MPAIRASRPDLVPALKEGASDGARGRFRLRDALVVAQMAVSLVLIVVGALFVRSLSAAADVPLGYDAGRIGFLTVPLEFIGYDDKRGGVLMEQARQRLAAVPGVQAVSLTSRLPLSLNNNGFGIRVIGQELPDDRPYTIDGAYVDEHYLNAMSLTLLAGRATVSADRDESRHVMVITRAMAERFWAGTPPPVCPALARAAIAPHTQPTLIEIPSVTCSSARMRAVAARLISPAPTPMFSRVCSDLAPQARTG